MPIPSSINDLSTTAASNSPGTTEDLGTADDYFRVYASYIAALRDVVLSGTANLSTANLTYTGTLTGSTGVLNIGSGQIYKDASGNVGIGTTSPGGALEVRGGNVRIRSTVDGTNGLLQVVDQGGTLRGSFYAVGSSYLAVEANGAVPIILSVNSTERFRIDSSGNQINAPSNTPPTLTANGQINITPTSNTNVRISYRGSDGTTRTADITLA